MGEVERDRLKMMLDDDLTLMILCLSVLLI